MSKERVAVRVEELTLSNTLQLTAIVELLEERGIMIQSDVVERMKAVSKRKKAYQPRACPTLSGIEISHRVPTGLYELTSGRLTTFWFR